MRHIVLVGAGHTHVGVLRAFVARDAPDAHITLIAPAPTLYYSGMLPAHVAGHYAAHELAIDTRGCLARLGASFVAAEVVGLTDHSVTLADGRTITADILSLDIGTAPAALAGAHPAVIPVKPVTRLLAGLADFDRRLASDDRPRRLAIIGGGAGGVELALSLAYRYRPRRPAPALDLVARSGVMAGAPGPVQRDLTRELAAARVNVITGRGVRDITEEGLIFDDDSHHAADAVIAATGARAPAWLADTGLALDSAGFIACDWTLASRSHAHVFAAGDVIALPEPRPKSGVYAVRQVPVLAENLRRAIRGEALTRFAAPAHALSLISTGDRRALAVRGRLSTPPSRLLWQLKDRIDRRFIARHHRPTTTGPASTG